MVNEVAVEVGESQKALEFFNSFGFRPVTNGLELIVIHLDALGTDYISEELGGGAVEFALLQLEVEVVFP